ncbi:Retrovirus-related Pol polyprotein from transposon 17.6 [Nosema granulosis]|uniref:Retrovirus-related Pol polyprotein from transposon 17.6 n=1 Tax=Nosema granulosis TaxID=83296 RepID=A0A9P6GYJ0_9MICR|nr:Retrovirus-related Pol polyprotein from transposon 17.6 [Nosema granulosis]
MKFILECDASDIGLGSVLRQEDRIIGYYSKKLHSSEMNYSIVEKEYLAMLLSLIHFKNIIQGCYVEIHTDSRNCVYDSKKTTTRIHRWKLLMNEFNYKIMHIKGQDNVIADQLSRCFLVESRVIDHEAIVDRYAIKKTDGSYATDQSNRICIDEKKAKDYLKEIHITSEHRGMSTIYNNIKDYIYLKNLPKLIKETVDTCIMLDALHPSNAQTKESNKEYNQD